MRQVNYVHVKVFDLRMGLVAVVAVPATIAGKLFAFNHMYGNYVTVMPLAEVLQVPDSFIVGRTFAEYCRKSYSLS